MAIIWSNLEEIEIGQKEREKHKKSIDQPFIDPNREKKEKFAKLICIPKQTTRKLVPKTGLKKRWWKRKIQKLSCWIRSRLVFYFFMFQENLQLEWWDFLFYFCLFFPGLSTSSLDQIFCWTQECNSSGYH